MLLGLGSTIPRASCRRATSIVARRWAHALPAHAKFLPAGEAGSAGQHMMPGGERPVACILGWVACGEKAIRKYGDLYTTRGIDVIALRLRPVHVALPVSRGRATMAAIADCLGAAENCERPIMIHGFSAGAYMYGNLLEELDSRGSAGLDIAQRIRGCVWDSPVDIDGVPFGLSRAVTDASGSSEGSLAQRLLQATLESYLSPRGPVRQYYQASSDAMHGKTFEHAGFTSPFAVPSSFIYSEADTVTRAADIRRVSDEWRAAGSDVETVVYEGTKHVSHLPADPARYEAAVARVIALGLGDKYATASKTATGM